MYYDLSKPITLQTDSNLKGLGAIFLQEVTQSSLPQKSPAISETYIAIELEALAVAWSIEKFHYFNWAKDFSLKQTSDY